MKRRQLRSTGVFLEWKRKESSRFNLLFTPCLTFEVFFYLPDETNHLLRYLEVHTNLFLHRAWRASCWMLSRRALIECLFELHPVTTSQVRTSVKSACGFFFLTKVKVEYTRAEILCVSKTTSPIFTLSSMFPPPLPCQSLLAVA